MSEHDGWEPPAGQRPTFDRTRMWLGILAGVVGTVTLTVLMFALVFPILVPVALFGALVVGIVLAAGQGPPTRRGLGLGLVIGWGLSLVIGGGVCLGLLRGFE